MSNQIEKATLSELNYKDYPEFMFAMVAAYLPSSEGAYLRLVAGSVVFRHEDSEGNTYKNGVLHSYRDNPAVSLQCRKSWYRDGLLHRDGDLPAVIGTYCIEWYQNGKLYRDGDLPAIIWKTL